MIFPEHMEFRYYITPERKECYELYSMTLGCRRTLLEKTQDLGQCLVDLYDTDFYDTYCVLSEINKLLRPLTPEHKDETAWRKLLELAMPLCKVHPFFGLLIKELSDLEENHAYGKNDTKDILLRFDRDFENIVSDAKALIEVCLDDRYQPNYSTAERYREAHYDARLCFDDMRYGELATEEVMLERPAYDSAYNYSVEKLREQGIKTALREVLYPNTVQDLYNYLKGYCLRLPLPIHKCKNCGRYYRVDIEDGEKQHFSVLHVACPYCGTTMSGEVHKTAEAFSYTAEIQDGREPYFGLELWFLTSFQGKPVWALNREHLAYLINYLSACLLYTSPSPRD